MFEVVVMLIVRLRSIILAIITVIAGIAILSAVNPAYASIAILTPDGSGDIRYDGTASPNTEVTLTVTATVDATEFGDSIEFYDIGMQSPNYMSIEVSPVSSFSVSGKASWTPLWFNLGGTMSGNTGSFAYSVGFTSVHYDVKIEAEPTDSSVTFKISSMYLADSSGNYYAVFNVNNVPDGVYSIQQDGVEVAKAVVGMDTYTINLKTGWNLVSMPLTPVDNSITSVIPADAMANIQIIWHYDNTNPNAPMWKFYKPGRAVNTLFSLTDGMGFWVLAKTDLSLTVIGSTPSEDHSTFNKGWNMVGPAILSTRSPSDLYGAYYLTWEYKDGQWKYYKPSRTVNTLTEITPGRGYWVLVR